MLPSSTFSFRGRLVGMPEAKEFGRRTVTQFVLQYDKQYMKEGEQKTFPIYVQFEVSSFVASPQDLANLSAGTELFVQGALTGRKSEKDGNVRYWNTNEVQAISVIPGAGEVGQTFSNPQEELPF